ncbi:MAG TPA: ABC transporter ATP-binding protein, partial [Tepidisphaeraceae bacterium]|nr:ABC transporter ATP-binding protein [Tepidisphaeraceae bacterium]
RVRAMIGAAFQSPALDGQLTVLENLHCHAALFGIDSADAHARVRELLERFGVSDRARDRVSVLSGGLRRRVELAKALLTRPRVLLLDEPSAGLDPDARRQLRELLRMLRDDGLTIALATHDTDEAELADQVAILNRGTLAGMGTPRELRARVGRTIVRVETDASPDARAGLPDLPGRLVSGDVVEYHLADPIALMAELLPRLGRSVRSIHAGPPSLAAAYFQLTGTLLETNN